MVTRPFLARNSAILGGTFDFWTFLKCPKVDPGSQYKKGIFLDF